MRELVWLVGAEPKVVRPDPQRHVPVHALLEPVLEPALRLVRRDEELHLHLLELPGPENEVPGRYLVAEALSDLGDPEWWLLAPELQVVAEVEEDPLRRLGAQVHDRPLVLDGADRRLEQQ